MGGERGIKVVLDISQHDIRIEQHGGKPVAWKYQQFRSLASYCITRGFSLHLPSLKPQHELPA